MKKLTLQDIKEHFSYCIDEGLAIGEQEEILLHSLYKKAEKMEEQQKEIESWKELHGSLSKRTTYLNKENARLREALEKAKRELSDDESIIDCARNAHYTVSQALKE